jgi:acetylglutamate kinase
MKPWVLKVGGRLCDDPGVRGELAQACAGFTGPLVLVHGGGVVVSELQTRLGVVPRFDAGRRITDAKDMPLVEMALAQVNGDLVRALVGRGCRAVGLSGCDAGLVRCDHVAALGAVGEPAQVDVTLLKALLAAGLTPVVSPVSLGPEGEPLNVNADELACAVAAALHAARLLLVSDVPGVKVGGVAQGVIPVAAVERLIAAGEVTGGMVPKLRSAARAIGGGVGEVRIAGFAPTLEAIGGTVVKGDADVE